jgi:hypothetical protein
MRPALWLVALVLFLASIFVNNERRMKLLAAGLAAWVLTLLL